MQCLRMHHDERSRPILIRTLGCLEIVIDGRPLHTLGRGPRRPLELLGILITGGVRGIPAGPLADLLWPDSEGFDAYRALITNVHRLRRTLGDGRAILFGAGRLSLNPEVCEVDVWALERNLSAVASAEQLEAVLCSYRGSFLSDDPGSWAIAMRRRLDQCIARAAYRTGSSPVRVRPALPGVYTRAFPGADRDAVGTRAQWRVANR